MARRFMNAQYQVQNTQMAVQPEESNVKNRDIMPEFYPI